MGSEVNRTFSYACGYEEDLDEWEPYCTSGWSEKCYCKGTKCNEKGNLEY